MLPGGNANPNAWKLWRIGHWSRAFVRTKANMDSPVMDWEWMIAECRRRYSAGHGRGWRRTGRLVFDGGEGAGAVAKHRAAHLIVSRLATGEWCLATWGASLAEGGCGATGT